MARNAGTAPSVPKRLPCANRPVPPVSVRPNRGEMVPLTGTAPRLGYARGPVRNSRPWIQRTRMPGIRLPNPLHMASDWYEFANNCQFRPRSLGHVGVLACWRSMHAAGGTPALRFGAAAGMGEGKGDSRVAPTGVAFAFHHSIIPSFRPKGRRDACAT